MGEVKIEDCRVGMVLKLKENCPFRKQWGVDLNTKVIGMVTYKGNAGITVSFKNMNRYWNVPASWNFYTDDESFETKDYEVASLNLEYLPKRKNNYY